MNMLEREVNSFMPPPIDRWRREPLSDIEWGYLLREWRQGRLIYSEFPTARAITIATNSPGVSCHEGGRLCGYCHEEGLPTNTIKPMPFEVFQVLFRSAVSSRACQVNISGGEPFNWRMKDRNGKDWSLPDMLIKFQGIIDKKKEKRPLVKKKVRVFTNGLSLGPELIRRIKGETEAGLLVSLDTLDPDTYQVIRGGTPAQFSHLTENVLPYLDERDAVHVTATTLNYLELPKIIKKFTPRGIGVYIEPVSPRGKGKDYSYTLGQAGEQKAIESIKQAYQEGGCAVWEEDTFMKPPPWEGLPSWSHLSLTWDGKTLITTNFADGQTWVLSPFLVAEKMRALGIAAQPSLKRWIRESLKGRKPSYDIIAALEANLCLLEKGSRILKEEYPEAYSYCSDNPNPSGLSDPGEIVKVVQNRGLLLLMAGELGNITSRRSSCFFYYAHAVRPELLEQELLPVYSDIIGRARRALNCSEVIQYRNAADLYGLF